MEQDVIVLSRISELNPTCLIPKNIVQNADKVKMYFGISESNPSGFWTAINLMQSEDIRTSYPSNRPHVIWDAANSEFKNALLELASFTYLPDNASYSKIEIESFKLKLDDALLLFSQTFPTLYKVFEDICPFIILGRFPGYGGGTVSTRIGIIWLSPSVDWKVTHWAENIVHEFIHNCLFLEDLVNNIFPYNSIEMENLDSHAISAIRQVKRPYDKSYHSAFVAYGLVEFYLRLSNFKKARKTLNPLLICVEDLASNTKYISANGVKLLDELIEGIIEQNRFLNSVFP
jgi:hypothetical protein